MLVYILALIIALGSLSLYFAAFFVPEVHRKADFLWSGVGLFYALILWVCASRMTGAVLLGQIAGVALLTWTGSEMIKLRVQLTPNPQEVKIPKALQSIISIIQPIGAKLLVLITQLSQTLQSKLLVKTNKNIIPEPTSEATPELTSEETPELTPEPTSEKTPEPTSEATPEATSEATPELTVKADEEIVDQAIQNPFNNTKKPDSNNET